MSRSSVAAMYAVLAVALLVANVGVVGMFPLPIVLSWIIVLAVNPLGLAVLSFLDGQEKFFAAGLPFLPLAVSWCVGWYRSFGDQLGIGRGNSVFGLLSRFGPPLVYIFLIWIVMVTAYRIGRDFEEKIPRSDVPNTRFQRGYQRVLDATGELLKAVARFKTGG